MMNPLYLAMGASFMAGVFGYIIVKFWILPIGRYLTLKKNISARLGALLNSVETPADPESRKETAAALRKLGNSLTESWELDVPHWYRMVLTNRKESPVEASSLLYKMADTREPEHIKRQIRGALGHLGLPQQPE